MTSKKKKLLIALGVASTLSLPAALLVSCSNSDSGGSGGSGGGSGGSGGGSGGSGGGGGHKEYKIEKRKDPDQFQKKVLDQLGTTPSQQIENGYDKITSSSQYAKVTKMANGDEYNYVIPSIATFTGSPGNATLITNFNTNTSMDSLFTISYFSLAKGATDPETQTKHYDTKSGWDVNNGDSVFIKIQANDGSLINGQSAFVSTFKVSGLSGSKGNTPFDDYYVYNENSTRDAYTKLSKQGATLNDAFSLMDLMKPGEVIQKGDYKLQMPKITHEVVEAQNPVPKSAALPFIDMSMATSTKEDLSVYDRYKYLSFAFIAGSKDTNGVKSGKWGGATGLDLNDPKIIDVINRIRNNGGDFVPSIGGANESSDAIWENADPIILARWIELIALQYHLNRIDYDIEGQHLSSSSLGVYATATALAQKKLEKDGHPLELTLTIAVEYNGLVNDGASAVKTFVDSGADITKLNGMTMMMNAKYVEDNGLGNTVINCLENMKTQLQEDYKNAGLNLSDEQLYNKVGTTIDIASDTWSGEWFTEPEIKKIFHFANQKHIGQIGYWSVGSEDPAINGMKMTLPQLVKVADDLHVDTSGKDATELLDDIISKLGGKLLVYGIYKEYDTTTDKAESTWIPQSDSIVTTEFNKEANAGTETPNSIYNRIDINLPTFQEALEKFKQRGGIPKGEKIKAPGLGKIEHVYLALFNATKDNKPGDGGPWKDMGPLLSEQDALNNSNVIADTLLDIYTNGLPIYSRYKNASGEIVGLPNLESKIASPHLQEIDDFIKNGAIVQNIPEFDINDPERNTYVGGEMTYIDNKIYIAKWDTQHTDPTTIPTPPAWDSKYIPL